MKCYKILFIASSGEDYMKDTVYHGLKTKFGKNVSTNVNLDYMYSNYPNPKQLYGKGFTIFCNLNPKQQVIESQESIINNITNKEYDYIVYGSIHRCREYWDLVKENYDKDHIILIDGEDHSGLLNEFIGYNYFKRELVHKIDEKLYPIWFGIPEKKICKNLKYDKKQDYATIIPGRLETYVFDDEKEYYQDYQHSKFGTTTKKAGWDCLRHYEILGNKCIPFFPKLEECPFYTMYAFPKIAVQSSEQLVQNWNQIEYNKYIGDLADHTLNYLTTLSIVEYIFNTVNKKYFTMENQLIKEEATQRIHQAYEYMAAGGEGHSVDIWEHMPTLKKYAQECEHITEMGVRSVVSTWAFLDTHPKHLVSYDITYHPNIEIALRLAQDAGISFDYILKNVLETEIEETDFLFLDTLHIYPQVKGELMLHASKVRKYIGFHDTTSFEWHGEQGGQQGIWPAIQEFLDEHPEWVIDARFYNCNGLTVLKRIAP